MVPDRVLVEPDICVLCSSIEGDEDVLARVEMQHQVPTVVTNALRREVHTDLHAFPHR